MKTIVGNWKMHLGVRESAALARGILREVRGREIAPEIVLCPSFTSLSEVHKVIAKSRVSLGAQDLAADAQGAHTGEISGSQLADVGCRYVIVGHSERRAGQGETGAMIAKKMRVAYAEGLQPILCVGEDATQQLAEALTGLESVRGALMIAYEPTYAIGTGVPASVGEVSKMHELIRREAAKLTGVKPDSIRVLYGGSVDGENAYAFLRERGVDGLLVGGESLKLNHFHQIVLAAAEVMTAQSE